MAISADTWLPSNGFMTKLTAREACGSLTTDLPQISPQLAQQSYNGLLDPRTDFFAKEKSISTDLRRYSVAQPLRAKHGMRSPIRQNIMTDLLRNCDRADNQEEC